MLKVMLMQVQQGTTYQGAVLLTLYFLPSMPRSSHDCKLICLSLFLCCNGAFWEQEQITTLPAGQYWQQSNPAYDN